MLVYQRVRETLHQWEFQDPKMKVLYHILGHILLGISPYIGLKNRPCIW